MKISDKGIKFIKEEQGLSFTAYLNSTGTWTIGYGYPGCITAGSIIIPEQAKNVLREGIAIF